jgi:hypothetical protein
MRKNQIRGLRRKALGHVAAACLPQLACCKQGRLYAAVE